MNNYIMVLLPSATQKSIPKQILTTVRLSNPIKIYRLNLFCGVKSIRDRLFVKYNEVDEKTESQKVCLEKYNAFIFVSDYTKVFR